MLRKLFARIQNLDLKTWWRRLRCFVGLHEEVCLYELTPNGQQPGEGKLIVCVHHLHCHHQRAHYYLWKHRENEKLRKQCENAVRAIKFWMMRKNAGWKV